MPRTIGENRAGSVSEIIAEFTTLGVDIDQAEIILSVGKMNLPGTEPVWLGVASVNLGASSSVSVPLVTFRRFDANFPDGTAFLCTEIIVLLGARLQRDGSMRILPQPRWPDGILVVDVRFPKTSINTKKWSEFDTYVLEVAVHKMGLADRVLKTIEHRGCPEKAVCFHEVHKTKPANLKKLVADVTDHFEDLLAGDAFSTEGLMQFWIWKGRSDLSQAIENTLKRSGMRNAREPKES